MSAAANKKLVQQVYTDSANRSGTTFVDNLAEDATWIVTGQYSWSHEFKGRDAINNGLMGHFRSFFAVRPRTLAFNFIAEGDYVVVEARGDNVTKVGRTLRQPILHGLAHRGRQDQGDQGILRFRAGRARARAVPGRAEAGGAFTRPLRGRVGSMKRSGM